jgi:hypothetical protein
MEELTMRIVKNLITTLTIPLILIISTGITAFAAPEATTTDDNNVAPLVEEEEEHNYAQEGVTYPLTVIMDGSLQQLDYTITFSKQADTHLYAPEGYKWVAAEWSFSANQRVDGNVFWYWQIFADESKDWIEVDNSFMSPFEDMEKSLKQDTTISVLDWTGGWVFGINENEDTYTCAAGIYVKEDGSGGIAYTMVPEDYEGSKILISGTKVENGSPIRNYDNEYEFQF